MMRKPLSIILTLGLVVALISPAISGKIQDKAWLGVTTQTIDRDLMEAFDLATDYGVIVKTVVPGSPADKADLRQGDIILKVEDAKLNDADQLADVIQSYSPGDNVEIKIIRKGKEKTIEAELGIRKSSDKARDYYFQSLPNMPQAYSKILKFDKSDLQTTYIGVQLESLNKQLGEYFGVEDGRGALITEVVEDSPAARAGLKAGDVIVKIDDDDTRNPDDVVDIVRDKEVGDKITVVVLREKQRKELAVEVDESSDMFEEDFMWFDEGMLKLPRMKGLLQGDFDATMPDMEEVREDLEELRHELKELQEEILEMKDKLD